jgi:nondiscriminating aspartyl-tRNA synthetase
VTALPEETIIAVEGLVTANQQAPGGAEITDAAITSLSGPAKPPPFDLYRPAINATLPVILDHAPTTLRHPRLRAGFEIAAASVAGFATRWTDWASPRCTRRRSSAPPPSPGRRPSGSTISASPPTWRSRRSSPSKALVGVFERVYEVGPVFRAEPHDTARHLAQYTSPDAELGFIASRTSPPRMSAGCASGRCASTGRNSCS